MKKTIIAAAIIAATTVGVFAQGVTVIQSRKAWMKENGAATAQGARMVKGEAPFDLAAARAVFKTYSDSSSRLGRLFPASSKTGEGTAALPAIWDKPADWRKAVAAYRGAVSAGAGKIKDLDSFKAAFGEVTKNCGSCHGSFRAKAS